MKYLITLLIAALSLNAFGQTEYPYPYNPDGNNDGLISLNDLMDLLALYGLEYNAGVLATDSISAIYYTGEMDYWDCASSCVGLRGNWKILDQNLVGSYKQELANQGSHIWLDLNNSPRGYNDNHSYVPYLETDTWDGRNMVTYYVYTCFCQTRTRADIEDINLCEGLEDECGVCNGEGAIYECGCTDIPEGDCDCNGSQLDAIGVCGGDCLEDLDGDGVCDPVLGPCEGQDFVSYHGYDYDIVETADGRCWFAENLRTKSFANGVGISEAPNTNSCGPCWINFNGLSETLINATAGCMEVLSNESNYVPFGEASTIIYNFQSVVDSQGLCPTGWRVPSKENFDELVASYGGPYSACFSLKAGDAGCSSYTTNESGLEIDARIYVYAHHDFAQYYFNSSILWTSDYYNPENKLLPNVARAFKIDMCGATSNIEYENRSLNYGLSVRCIKD